MTISDTDFGELGLKLLPARTRSYNACEFLLAHQSNGWRFRISKAARDLVHLPAPGHVQVLVGRGVIAVRECRPSDPQARRIAKNGEISFPDAEILFEIGHDQKARFPVDCGNGHLIGRIPADLKIRRKSA